MDRKALSLKLRSAISEHSVYILSSFSSLELSQLIAVTLFAVGEARPTPSPSSFSPLHPLQRAYSPVRSLSIIESRAQQNRLIPDYLDRK